MRHDVRRLKEELHARKALRQLFAQIADVSASRLSTNFLQLDENLRVGTPDRAGVAISEVDAAVRQADIVEDRGQLVFGDGVANDSVDLVGETRRFLDAQTGTSAHVQANLSGVNLRKEVTPQNADEQHGQNTEGEEAHGEKPRGAQSGAQGSAVAFAKLFKTALKSLLIAPEEAHLFADVFLGVIFVFRAQQIHGQRRHDRARPHVGSQHGKAYGFSERDEQELGYAGKKKHRNKDDANAQCGNESGHSNLLRAVEDGLNGFLAHGQIAVDVFDLNGGVIHENSDCERKAAQGHDIDGLAQRAEAENADEDR